MRVTVSALLQSRQQADGAARNLKWTEEQLREAGRYDAVLVSIGYNVPVAATGHVAEGLALEEWISFLNGPAMWEWARGPVPMSAREAYGLARGTAELRKFLEAVR